METAQPVGACVVAISNRQLAGCYELSRAEDCPLDLLDNHNGNVCDLKLLPTQRNPSLHNM